MWAWLSYIIAHPLPDGGSGHFDPSPSSEVDNTIRIPVQICGPPPAPTFPSSCPPFPGRAQFDRLDLSDPTVTFQSSIISSLWERLSSELRVTVKNACEYRIGVWGAGEWWVMMSHLGNHSCVASPGSWVDFWCLFISHLPKWVHQQSWRPSFYSEIISLL